MKGIRDLPVAEFAARIRQHDGGKALVFIRMRGQNSWLYTKDWPHFSCWFRGVEGAVSEVVVWSE